MKLANLWRKKKVSPYGFFTGYSSWEEALRDSTSYTAASVVEGTLGRRKLLLQSFDPADIFVDERTQQLLSAVAVILGKQSSPVLKVLDFGGSFGLYYYLLRRALPEVKIDWTVIETAEMAEAFQPYQETHLRWYTSLPAALNSGEKAFDLCLASSSLPYVPHPYEILDKLAQLGRYVVATRMGFIGGAVDKVAVQRVPPEIFTGSYPAWFFSRERFVAAAQKLGKLKLRWDVPQDVFMFEGKKIIFSGYLLECR